MTITTQVLGTTLLTLTLLVAAMWANGIPPVAPRVAACLDTTVAPAITSHASTPGLDAAPSCGDAATIARAGTP